MSRLSRFRVNWKLRQRGKGCWVSWWGGSGGGIWKLNVMVCGWSTNRRDREPWPVQRQASTTTSRMSQANNVMFLELGELLFLIVIDILCYDLAGYVYIVIDLDRCPLPDTQEERKPPFSEVPVFVSKRITETLDPIIGM
ncbi:hypothetical protein SNOG_06251 [Parastagonospora nodorum SN15]|uniref:Uncharacterized protein n=1 Tax=Phaeosphaeria nodorum (strain SN15 / ATCC MYA-4574 / FGSC 10173) TaxID=321614 RepID=Q0UPR3_PHANO|nr:hypothetical protein SNOG_06251 [Parastagonospora nodorum SN15]EAT86082.1 hypothetical protein SNOG_06251 [Parastagonospora nodorum SN15]